MVEENKLSELRRNYDAFLEALPTLLPTHNGKYALMRHGSVVAYFDTPADALMSGRAQFSDDLFSVQTITDSKADLGWYTRAADSQSL